MNEGYLSLRRVLHEKFLNKFDELFDIGYKNAKNRNVEKNRVSDSLLIKIEPEVKIEPEIVKTESVPL